jgi:hypothetical protein
MIRNHTGTVTLINNAHCNASNISDRRLVVFADFFANGFGFSILQPASTEGMVVVTVLVFLRRGLSVPVTNPMGYAVCTDTTVRTISGRRRDK